jgi:hypothetical protein
MKHHRDAGFEPVPGGHDLNAGLRFFDALGFERSGAKR